MSLNKKSYFQGGGGENEPTPGKKKYKSDPAILVQPRFEEPFYRNYDYLDTEGIDGEPQYGPGSGWNHIMEHKSIKDFLYFRRQRLKGKYVADDFWIEDNEANRKQRVEKMKVRASLLSKVMIKTAASNTCEFCGKNKIDTTFPCEHCGKGGAFSVGDKNDGANYDYGDGAYTAMSEGKKMDTITDAPHKSPGAFFADAQYMLPPKEHGTSIYDSKNSPYQGTPKTPNKSKADDNAIDFPIDSQVTPIIGETGSYPASVQIGGYLDKYLPLDDFGGKSPDKLDFGRDYDDDDGLLEGLDLGALEKLMEKYISTQEPGIFGLPDGIHPSEDKDPSATINHINPEAGETDSGNTLYEDKWNI